VRLTAGADSGRQSEGLGDASLPHAEESRDSAFLKVLLLAFMIAIVCMALQGCQASWANMTNSQVGNVSGEHSSYYTISKHSARFLSQESLGPQTMQVDSLIQFQWAWSMPQLPPPAFPQCFAHGLPNAPRLPTGAVPLEGQGMLNRI
jgi:hypothetical protein